MAPLNKLSISLSGRPIAEILEAVVSTGLFDTPPPKFSVDGEVSKAPAKWIAKLAATEQMTQAFWPQDPDDEYGLKTITVSPRHGSVTVNVLDAFTTRDEGLAIVESLPFTLCSVGDVRGPLDTEARAFVGHTPLGWGCAFRGNGHDVLVSRRWLEFGPWKLLSRPKDLSIVLFHQLEANKKTAGKQAGPGHDRMASWDTGGYVRTPNPFKGLYKPSEHKLEIVVNPGAEVSQKEMNNACWARARKQTGKDRIERLAYVFIDGKDAKAHLHEMWLRDLEVWYVDGKGNHRIDDDYFPSPKLPAWGVGK